MVQCAKCGKELDSGEEEKSWNCQLEKGYIEEPIFVDNLCAFLGKEREFPEYKGKKICRECAMGLFGYEKMKEKEYRVKHLTIRGGTFFQEKGHLTLYDDKVLYNAEQYVEKYSLSIPIDKIEDVHLITDKEITAFRVFMIGFWGLLFKKKRDSLTIDYKDNYNIMQHETFQTLDYGDIEEIQQKIYEKRKALKIGTPLPPNSHEMPPPP